MSLAPGLLNLANDASHASRFWRCFLGAAQGRKGVSLHFLKVFTFSVGLMVLARLGLRDNMSYAVRVRGAWTPN